jgi:hypothetical protein
MQVLINQDIAKAQADLNAGMAKVKAIVSEGGKYVLVGGIDVASNTARRVKVVEPAATESDASSDAESGEQTA